MQVRDPSSGVGQIASRFLTHARTESLSEICTLAGMADVVADVGEWVDDEAKEPPPWEHLHSLKVVAVRPSVLGSWLPTPSSSHGKCGVLESQRLDPISLMVWSLCTSYVLPPLAFYQYTLRLDT